MKRSLIFLSVLFTGLCNNLVYGAQSAAATTPARRVAQNPQASPNFYSPNGRPLSFAALHHQQNSNQATATVTVTEEIDFGLAQSRKTKTAVSAQTTTDWQTKLKILASNRWTITAATLVAVVCGLTLGETKYKMVSQLFKKAPATIPAKAVKGSWLKSLTGLFVR